MKSLVDGVPLVGYPQFSDQVSNIKMAEEVWGTGVRARVEEGIVKREELKIAVLSWETIVRKRKSIYTGQYCLKDRESSLDSATIYMSKKRNYDSWLSAKSSGSMWGFGDCAFNLVC
ncbi:hypothetical protein RND71_026151 [Anisodus tanguticus]|uniref:Uncharacterized protein n=1 Tax=Anisodus tanguticus TaxID=243964 RepID=A0AAE1RNC6_9SOLA|nr:hypothetical protein RND71_026151 [Anisodus tanguticus]